MTIDTLSGNRAHTNGQAAAKRITVKGQRMVMVADDEYERLLQKARNGK